MLLIHCLPKTLERKCLAIRIVFRVAKYRLEKQLLQVPNLKDLNRISSVV